MRTPQHNASQRRPWRVGVVAIQHESNTFAAGPTTLEHFQQGWLWEADWLPRLAGSHHEVGGFLEGLAAAGMEAVPLLAARAMPYGRLEGPVFARLVEMLDARLAAVGPLDAVLAAPHGAAVSVGAADADGAWLARLRQQLPAAPIVATLDLHANLTTQMVDQCDALVGYRENPHLDQRARGSEAAALVAATLRGEVRPVLAAAFPPLAINIERQLTSEPQLQAVYRLAAEQRARPGILSVSILLGFPYADVAEMGCAVTVVADGDADLAARAAAELAAQMWSDREDYLGHLEGPDQVLDRLAAAAGPICLLDMGDNVGGGSPGDGTTLAHALHQRRLADSFVCLFDPAAARAAAAAGTGGSLEIAVGGKLDALHGPPLVARFTVVSLHEGRFEEPEARHGGASQFDMGPTAVLRTADGLLIMATSQRVFPVSLHQLTSCGIDPTQLRFIVAKGVNAPVTAYAQVCRELVRVDTIGSTSANMEHLAYADRRRPLFPFERDCEWSPHAYISARARPGA